MTGADLHPNAIDGTTGTELTVASQNTYNSRYGWGCPDFMALPPFRCLIVERDEKRAGAARKRDLARPSGNRQPLIWADMPAAKP